MRVPAEGVSGRDGPLTALGAEVWRVAGAVLETEAASEKRSHLHGSVLHVLHCVPGYTSFSAVSMGSAGGAGCRASRRWLGRDYAHVRPCM
ncbi:hypothetical protein NDU88_007825 [Pleurodeles waltl]|uniref:Uncharacterized protein n=1 Tax=Pleurodeles waltl TaxID=8319 RepID=A0AAV7N4S5_PLEWA|nr:hypothetical protein NDU88_007825 [Pleurodeles waltl]